MARRFRRRNRAKWLQTFGDNETNLTIDTTGTSSLETSNILLDDDITQINNAATIGPLNQFSTLVIKRIVGYWHASLNIGQRQPSGEGFEPGSFSVVRWSWGIFASQVDTSGGFGGPADFWDPSNADKQRWRWLVRRHHLFANPFAVPIDVNAFDFPSNNSLTFGQNQGPFFDWKGTCVIPFGHRLWITQSGAAWWLFGDPIPGAQTQVWGVRNIRVCGYIRQGGWQR